MTQHKDKFPIEKMGKVLKISPSAYYEWCANPHGPRAAKRRDMLEFILEGRKDRMKQFYGSPRWTAKLKSAGYSVSEAMVALLMKLQGSAP
jgi:hypothetical protein